MAGIRRLASLAALASLGLLGLPPGPEATAQDGLPPLPAPSGTVPPSAGTAPNDLEDLVRRLQKLEDDNKALREEVKATRSLREDYQRLSDQYDRLSKKVEGGGDGGAVRSRDDSGNDDVGVDSGFDDSTGPGSSGGGARSTNPQVGENPKRPTRIKLGKAYYDIERDGFRFEDEDGEFQLRIRGMVQTDARIYTQGGQEPVNSGFYLPRTRFYFDGHLTKPIEYQLSFQRGYNTLDVLNAYLNFHYSDHLQLRIGRFKTPYTYEFYKQNAWRLMVPERSLFNVNFALNRQIGLMGWGELFDKRLEYAVGAFDGGRNTFQNYDDSLDVVGFLNFKPWQNTDGPLKNLNLGGSVAFGNQDNPLHPVVLRTSVNASTADLGSSSATNQAAVPFLEFNPNITERGDRALWSLHLAYFYKGLTLMGAWDSGFADYASSVNSRRVRVPLGGYYAQLGYLVTGEEISERVLVNPIRPFDLRPGHFGLGAFEPYARYSSLNLGSQVFTAGLADPNLWTNNAQMVDLGVNWYLNKFVKIYFDWEHAMFGQPVFFAPGPRLQKTSDLFWLRFQVYF